MKSCQTAPSRVGPAGTVDRNATCRARAMVSDCVSRRRHPLRVRQSSERPNQLSAAAAQRAHLVARGVKVR